MRGSAEAIKADRRARLHPSPLDRAIAYDTRTKEGSGFLIAERGRQRIGEILAHDRPLGIAAVVIPSSEAGVRAEVFSAAPAINADAAGLAQPRNTDTIARRETFARRAQSLDYADYLMPGNDTWPFRRQVAF